MTVSGIHLLLGLLLLLLLLVDEGRDTGKPERPADPHRGLEVDLVRTISYGACCFIRTKPASFTHPRSSRFLTGRTPLLPPAS
ncbi:hypothetical protein BHM03_00018561 [Ensete ventricosum]|nr:hypothetical protein BHM03_00018561 [Ensete ventricosum]